MCFYTLTGIFNSFFINLHPFGYNIVAFLFVLTSESNGPSSFLSLAAAIGPWLLNKAKTIGFLNELRG